MSTIRSGLTAVGLAALAVGTLAPAAAHAAPAITDQAPAEAPSASPTAPSAPRIAFVEPSEGDKLSVAGMAPGARLAGVIVEGGGSYSAAVWNDRFATLVDVADRGKKATLVSYTPQGKVEVEFVLETQYAEGENEAPGTPVIHAVSQYDDGHFVIEGTVAHQPDLFSKTEVWANRSGMSWDFPSENGSFSLTVPASRAGEVIEVTAYYRGHGSETAQVELVPTERNTASDVHPLEVASPTAGDVLAAPEATFAGSGIPNSQIVVTRDEKTNRASSTLCETRVTSLGDWSCTSPALPAGSYRTAVTETPTWASAPKQETSATFTVAPTEDVDPTTPARPLLSSVHRSSTGDIVVRVIVNRAHQAEIRVGEHREQVSGLHGRFSFVLDGSLEGQTATVTGIGSPDRGRSLDIPLTPAEIPAPSPLAAPLAHSVGVNSDGTMSILGTTSYFANEFDVPGVIAQFDGRYIGGTGVTWNGAYAITVDPEYAGEEIDLITVRGTDMSEKTPIVLEATDENTAPETFPLDVVSPAEGETIDVDTDVFTGEGIPGSIVTLSTDVGGTDEPAATLGDADVLADGTWTLELDVTASLTPGEHTMTVVETPYWDSLKPLTSTRTFTASENVEPAPETRDLTIEGDGTVSPTGLTTLTGAGHPGSTVTLHPFGEGRGGEVSTEVRPDGTWNIARGFGPSKYNAAVFVQTGGPGADQSVPFPLDGTRTPSLIIDGDGTVSPTGRTTLTGTGDAGATVTLHPFGQGRGGEVSTEVRADGTWSISRGFGPTTYTAAVFVQTGGPAADQSVPFPLDGTRTSSLIIDGDGTVSPTGRTTLTGTGDAGATVTLHPFGQGRGGEVSTEVRPDGSWSISRGFGPSKYNAAVFVQTGGPGADQSVPFPLDGT
ncbi:hypothetical protein, partial [Frigoribacterium sp. MEB024]|uniref:hypothetical protein n=1 Tax=Frigoribacterium sp. MEB024 TaxID=1589899 RepID=UPI0005B9E15C